MKENKYGYNSDYVCTNCGGSNFEGTCCMNCGKLVGESQEDYEAEREREIESRR